MRFLPVELRNAIGLVLSSNWAGCENLARYTQKCLKAYMNERTSKRHMEITRAVSVTAHFITEDFDLEIIYIIM